MPNGIPGLKHILEQFLLTIDKFIKNNEVIIYGHKTLISKVKHLSNKVNFIIDDTIPGNSFKALKWRKKNLPNLLDYYSADVHFNLMGWMQHRKKNIIRVGMNRNLQPFISEAVKINPYFSKEYVRLKLYKSYILKSYNNCHGVIFNSVYAEEIIKPYLKSDVQTKVIHHGVNETFRCAPRKQSKTDDLSILYISDFYPYKNQEVVIQAVDNLRKSNNLNLKLNLIGKINYDAQKRVNKILKSIDNSSNWLTFHNRVTNENLRTHFLANDIFIFASSVESFGHTLVEAMAAGMPIICSDKRPMKDFLGNDAVLVNEKSIEDMAAKILLFTKNPDLRYQKAKSAFKAAKAFSYEKMTKETLEFLELFE